MCCPPPQCIAELGDNAIKYGGAGHEVVIQISLGSVHAGAAGKQIGAEGSLKPNLGSATGNTAACSAEVSNAGLLRLSSTGLRRLSAGSVGSVDTVSGPDRDTESIWLEVALADSGFIPPELQERLFSPFSQQTRPGGVKPAGLGLGAAPPTLRLRLGSKTSQTPLLRILSARSPS